MDEQLNTQEQKDLPKEDKTQQTESRPDPPPLAKEWYVGSQGEQKGPFNLTEIIEEIRGKRLHLSDLGWKKGMAEWIPLETIPEIKNAFKTGVSGEQFQAGASKAAEVSKAATKDAFKAFKVFFLNPIGGLLPAYRELGLNGAFSVGIVFFVAYELFFLLGALILKSRFASDVPLPLGIYIRYLVALAIPFISATAALSLLRLITKGRESYQADLFISGAAFLQIGIVAFIASFLGPLNIEVSILAGLFGICFFILILYAGLANIHQLGDSKAAICVPITIAVAAFICKIIIASFIDQNTFEMFDKMF